MNTSDQYRKIEKRGKQSHLEQRANGIIAEEGIQFSLLSKSERGNNVLPAKHDYTRARPGLEFDRPRLISVRKSPIVLELLLSKKSQKAADLPLSRIKGFNGHTECGSASSRFSSDQVKKLCSTKAYRPGFNRNQLDEPSPVFEPEQFRLKEIYDSDNSIQGKVGAGRQTFVPDCRDDIGGYFRKKPEDFQDSDSQTRRQDLANRLELFPKKKKHFITGFSGIDLKELESFLTLNSDKSGTVEDKITEMTTFMRHKGPKPTVLSKKSFGIDRGNPDRFDDPSWVCKRWKPSKKRIALPKFYQATDTAAKPDMKPRIPRLIQTKLNKRASRMVVQPTTKLAGLPAKRIEFYRLISKQFSKAIGSRPKLMEIRDQPQIPCTFSTITQELHEARTVLSRKLEEGSVYYSRDEHERDEFSPPNTRLIYESGLAHNQAASTTRSCRVSERRFVFKQRLEDVSPKDRIGRLSGSSAQTHAHIASERFTTSKFVKPNSSFGKEHKKKMSLPFNSISLNSGTSLNFEQESAGKPKGPEELDWETQQLVAKYIKLDEHYHCSPNASGTQTPMTMSPQGSPSKLQRAPLSGALSPDQQSYKLPPESPQRTANLRGTNTRVLGANRK